MLKWLNKIFGIKKVKVKKKRIFGYNTLLLYKGVRYRLRDLAEECGIHPATFRDRLEHGLTIPQAIKHPLGRPFKKIKGVNNG